jgi:hypothetical protein
MSQFRNSTEIIAHNISIVTVMQFYWWGNPANLEKTNDLHMSLTNFIIKGVRVGCESN